MALKDTLALRHQPHAVMPVENPIQYIIESGATHEYNYDVNCFAQDVIASNFDVWHIKFSLGEIALGDYIEINGIQFEFVDCITRRSGNQIVLDNTSLCDMGLEIIKALKDSYYSKQEQFKVLEYGQSLECDGTTYETDCNVAPGFGIYIYSTTFEPLVITTFTTDPANSLQAVNVCPFTDSFLEDYKVRVCLFGENSEHNSDDFILLGDVSNYPELQDQTPFNADVVPERLFYFNIEQLLKSILRDDLPSFNFTTPQFAVNSIKQFYIKYGDTYLKNNKVFSSRLEQGETFRVLDASFEQFGSDYSKKWVNIPGSCYDYTNQANLLQPYFKDFTTSDQKFLTNSRNKLLTPDRFEYLHFWLPKGTNLQLLSGFFDVTYCDGTTKTIEADKYDFAELSGCEDARKQDEQILIIPLHAVMDTVDLTNVCSFCFYLQHPDCLIPSTGGRIDIDLQQGGTIFEISTTCFTMIFAGLGFAEFPSGVNEYDLAFNLYDLFTTTNTPAWNQFVNDYQMSFEYDGSTVVSIIFEATPPCEAGTGTAVMKFTILDDPSYTWGSVGNERGFYIDFLSNGCNCFLPCIPTLARFSNAMSFVNYLDNLATYFNDYFVNGLSSTITEVRAPDNSFAEYTVFLDIAYIQANHGIDICSDPLNFCIFGTQKGQFIRDDSFINLKVTQDVTCCSDSCCGESVLINYINEPVPLDGREQIRLEFNMFGYAVVDLARIYEPDACQRTIYDFELDNFACYNTYLTGHTTAASMAQGLIDFYNNCADVTWTGFVAAVNLTLTLESPTVVIWEQDFPASECCNKSLVRVERQDGQTITNRIFGTQCYTVPPLHFVTDVQCCDVTEEKNVIASELMPYRYTEQCLQDTGFIFKNRFGMNECIYFDGVPNTSTEVERTNYQKNIYLNNNDNNMREVDRETNTIATEGRQMFNLASSYNDHFFISTYLEFFHSTKIRIFERRRLEFQCGDTDCDTVYTDVVTPVIITSNETELNTKTEDLTNIEFEFTKSNKYNFK